MRIDTLIALLQQYPKNYEVGTVCADGCNDRIELFDPNDLHHPTKLSERLGLSKAPRLKAQIPLSELDPYWKTTETEWSE